MTKEDFVDWKRHPVTQQVFSQLAERAGLLNEELIFQVALLPQSQMAEKAGYIKAIRDLVNIEYEEGDSNGN